MEQGAEFVRQSLRAPGEAPQFFMEGVELLFNSMWDDVRLSLVDYLMVAFGKATGKFASAETPPDSPGPPFRLRRLGHLRSWLLYTWFPHDVSFWTQLRNPGYWALTALSLCPRYGVAALFWLLLGTLIERRDEYQLCCYILGLCVRSQPPDGPWFLRHACHAC